MLWYLRQEVTLISNSVVNKGEKIMIIIQQNLKSNNSNIRELMITLMKEEPDLLFFSEFCYVTHKQDIIDRLLLGDQYDIFLPCSFGDDHKKNPKITAACMLAVKKEYKFVKRERRSVIQSLRYIEGNLSYNNETIECFFAYVQQLYVPQNGPYTDACVNEFLRKSENKANMLFEMYRFSEEHKASNIFIGGDLNTDISSEDARMRSIFQPLYDNLVDTYNDFTWKKVHLDYALISKFLNDNYLCNTKPIETTSDHLALHTEIGAHK